MNDCISVIIPTKNAGESFRESLDMIFSQEIAFQLEVVIIDSGSTDQTLQICADYPVKLIQISASSFNHSATRNLAISESCGDICVLTVQDAIPVDDRWLTTLVEPLVKDDKVAGVFGQQVARDDASFFTKYCQLLYYREWRSDWKQEYEQLPIETDDWEKLSHEQRRVVSRFDNTNSCVRRSVWEEIPFPVVPFAEDVAWAIDVLTAGFSIFWKPTAQVFHSHERPLSYTLKRSYVDSKTIAVLLGDRSSSSMSHQMARSLIKWLSKEAVRYLQSISGQWEGKKYKSEILAEADRCWQLTVNAGKSSDKDGTMESGSDLLPGAVSLKDRIVRQYYRSVSGPPWFRKMCRNVFRNGRLLRKKFKAGAGDNQSITLELQACHRYFLNLLLSVHLENADRSVDSGSSVRYGAAIMVAGSFLGQNIKAGDRTEELISMDDDHVGVRLPGDIEVWKLLNDWYEQGFDQEATAISRLDQILTDGV